MITSVSDWLSFLRSSESLMALPLLVGGFALMLFGWRMWKACVVLAFGLIGTSVGMLYAGPGPDQWLYGAGCGILLALVSYRPANYALALLGGLVGAGFVMHTLGDAGMRGYPLWITGVVSLIGATAMAFLNRQLVVIAVTAFLGAVLLISGFTVVVMDHASMYRTFHSMAHGSAIVLPFLLLVPTVMSGFYQVAEVRRANAEM